LGKYVVRFRSGNTFKSKGNGLRRGLGSNVSVTPWNVEGMDRKLVPPLEVAIRKSWSWMTDPHQSHTDASRNAELKFLNFDKVKNLLGVS